VLDERFGLVLREHVDAADSRIDQVAEDEVDDPVAVGEGKRRLGLFGGERIEPRAFTAR